MSTSKMYRVLNIAMACIIGMFFVIPAHAASLTERLLGHILVQVESKGEAWYVDRMTGERWYLGRPSDAFQVMRARGLGISNSDLARLPRAGTMEAGDAKLVNRLRGRIVLHVQANGEAWYVSPRDGKRYFLGRPADAFQVMRAQGLGITNENLDLIAIADASARPMIVIIPAQLVQSDTPITSPIVETLPASTEPLTPPIVSVVEHVPAIPRISEEQQEMSEHVNGSRRARGVSQLLLNNAMNAAATSFAYDMIARDYFKTHTPEGKSVKELLAAQGYEPRQSGVLIAEGPDETAEAFGLWNGSDSTTIINKPEYEDLGVAYVQSPTRRRVWVVFFASSEVRFEDRIKSSLADTTAWQNAMLLRLNLERANAGRAQLNFNVLLHETAQAYAEDMLKRDFFDHTDPDGTTPHQRITHHGYPALTSAENLAKGPTTVTEVMDGWMNSPGHKVNILFEQVNEVGLGLAMGRNTKNEFQIYWVQHFGRR